MSLFVATSQEETCKSIIDYLRMRRYKILTSTEPTQINVEFGSWVKQGKGHVRISVHKRNGGSYVNLDFDTLWAFAVECIMGAALALFVFLLTWVLGVAIPPLPKTLGSALWFYILILYFPAFVWAVCLDCYGKRSSKTAKELPRRIHDLPSIIVCHEPLVFCA